MATKLDKAVEALLSINSESYKATRMNHEPSAVLLQVLTVKTKRGKMLLPLTYDIKLELIIDLHEDTKTYSFSGRAYERTRFSVNTETFKGVYRRKEWGQYITQDGVTAVKYDTGAIFDEIENTLHSIGWKRN